MNKVLVSIIVPTFKDWERLSLCVGALSKQSYPGELFEVIIVNNDPGDPAPPDFVLPPGFQVLTEATIGSYAARNAGLKVARGNIIGFTDADCIPDPKWIENAVLYFTAHSDCSRIAGHISILYKGPQPTLAESYNALFAFPQQNHARLGTCATGNMFTRKRVLEVVGAFNERLLSIGDLEWGKRAMKAGFTIHYVQGVLVKHPARTLLELIKKEKRVGGGQGSVRNYGKMRNLLSCLNDIRPRLGVIKFIYKGSPGLGITNQCKILLLRHYLLCIRALEKFRVLQGKQPERT